MKAVLLLVVIEFLLVSSRAAWHPGEMNLSYPVWTYKNKIPDFTTPRKDEDLTINDEDELKARITEGRQLNKHTTARNQNAEKTISIAKISQEIEETAASRNFDQLKNKTNNRADSLLKPIIPVTKINDKLGQLPLLERLKARVKNPESSFTQKPVVPRIDNIRGDFLPGIRSRIAESLNKFRISTPEPLSLTRKVRQMDPEMNMPMFDMLPNQMPSQVRPDVNSMPAFPPGLDVNAYKQCLNRCLHTQEYNPVCGSNGRIYHNLSRLRCDATCGVPVTLRSYGSCAQPQRPQSSFLQSASPNRLRPQHEVANNQQIRRQFVTQVAGGQHGSQTNTNLRDMLVLH